MDILQRLRLVYCGKPGVSSKTPCKYVLESKKTTAAKISNINYYYYYYYLNRN
jgi:hypothetical protein